MTILLDIALTVGLFLPYTVGKTATLIAVRNISSLSVPMLIRSCPQLRPRQGIVLLKLPIRVVRILTDPVVESLMYVVWLTIRPFSKVFSSSGARGDVSGASGVGSLASKGYALAKLYGTHTKAITADMLQRFLRWWPSSNPRILLSGIVARSSNYLGPEKVGRLQDFRVAAEQGAADLWRSSIDRWKMHALGNEPHSRAFAVALGYCVVAIILSMYLGMSSSNVGAARRVIRNTIRQQVIVVKVGRSLELSTLLNI